MRVRERSKAVHRGLTYAKYGFLLDAWRDVPYVYERLRHIVLRGCLEAMVRELADTSYGEERLLER